MKKGGSRQDVSNPDQVVSCTLCQRRGLPSQLILGCVMCHLLDRVQEQVGTLVSMLENGTKER